ncbi:Bud site selection protein, Revert to axial protein 1 [Mycoemilia scoparia]|uniref:Bud site selection protein, Revert to axial protein 1 n=1 Tax=Mycoemilia scoparia TaxID=417184 RepID=A0A9W7ZWH4_9FUNG|nr:Bud site selection protein, Revert to axial protein 1 [Mycoemilia scoparia]
MPPSIHNRNVSLNSTNSNNINKNKNKESSEFAESEVLSSLSLFSTKTPNTTNSSKDVRGIHISDSLDGSEPKLSSSTQRRFVASNDTMFSSDRSRMSRSSTSNTTSSATTTSPPLSPRKISEMSSSQQSQQQQQQQQSTSQQQQQGSGKRPPRTLSQLLALPSIPENEDVERTTTLPIDNTENGRYLPQSFDSSRSPNDRFDQGTTSIHAILSNNSNSNNNNTSNNNNNANDIYGSINWSQIEDHNLSHGGLPTLGQVLSQKTQSPLSLQDFITHCTVRQPQARRWLEFYFAARAHKAMCKEYVSIISRTEALSAAGGVGGGAGVGGPPSSQVTTSMDSGALPESMGTTTSSSHQQQQQNYAEILAGLRSRQNSEDISIHQPVISQHEKTLRALNGQGRSGRRHSHRSSSRRTTTTTTGGGGGAGVSGSSRLNSNSQRTTSHQVSTSIGGITNDRTTYDSIEIANLAAQIQETKDLIISRYFRAALDPTVRGTYNNMNNINSTSSPGAAPTTTTSGINSSSMAAVAATSNILSSSNRFQGSVASPSPHSSRLVTPGFRNFLDHQFSGGGAGGSMATNLLNTNSSTTNSGTNNNYQHRFSDASDIRRADASSRVRTVSSTDPLTSSSGAEPVSDSSPRAMSTDSQFLPVNNHYHRHHHHRDNSSGSPYLRPSRLSNPPSYMRQPPSTQTQNMGLSISTSTNRNSYNTSSNHRTSSSHNNNTNINSRSSNTNPATSSNSPNNALSNTSSNVIYLMVWPDYVLTDMSQRLQAEEAELDGSLFNAAISHAYQMLDTMYYPVFLKDATTRNVTRPHGTFRVMVAYFILVFAFALPLSLILLNHKPKATRAWCLIPQLIGWYNMVTGFSGCDILLAVFRRYQFPQYFPSLLFCPEIINPNPNAKLSEKSGGYHHHQQQQQQQQQAQQYQPIPQQHHYGGGITSSLASNGVIRNRSHSSLLSGVISSTQLRTTPHHHHHHHHHHHRHQMSQHSSRSHHNHHHRRISGTAGVRYYNSVNIVDASNNISHTRYSSGGVSQPLQQQQQPQPPTIVAANRRPSWKEWLFVISKSHDNVASMMVLKRTLKWHAWGLIMCTLSTVILCVVPGTHIFKS